jgi:hypothetical protein
MQSVIGINPQRWFDRMQPQTLQIATMLAYFECFFSAVAILDGGGYIGFLARRSPFWLFIVVVATGCLAVGGLLMANDRRLGWRLLVAASLAPFILRIATMAILGASSASPLDWIIARPAGGSVLTVIFDAALVALLLHPQSRNHQRLWYR